MVSEVPTLKGEVGPEGRAICYYLEGGGAAVPLGKIGIGSGTKDKSGYLDLHAEIGAALDCAIRREADITGGRPPVSLLILRWVHYLSMVYHRNAIKTHKKASRAALEGLPDPWALEKLRDAEEGILAHSEAFARHRKTNDRLRRDPLYLELMDVFREELRRRRVRI
jgi:hypothetical protein